MTLLPLLLALVQDAPAPPSDTAPAAELARPGVELSDGEAADAWTAVAIETAGAALPMDRIPAGPGDPAWEREDTWLDWARWVREEAQTSEPARRARLAWLAWQQGRSDDAWSHVAAAAADPAQAAGVLPLLLPGVPVAHYVQAGPGTGGVTPPLPDGVVLTPALPPPGVDNASPLFQRRAMRVNGLKIGPAVVSLEVALEPDGVQVEVTHVEGGRAHVAILIPEPPDYEIRVEYADWMRQDTLGVPLELTLEPGAEPSILYGRFIERRAAWTLELPATLPSSVAENGFALALDPDDSERARMAAFGSGLRELLGLPVQRLESGDTPADFGGILIDLRPAERREAKLVALISQAERFALRPNDSGPNDSGTGDSGPNDTDAGDPRR